ncbi:histidine-type phosphatase [Sphingomonas sp. CJ20]
MRRLILAGALLATTAPLAAREPAPPAGLKADRVVVLMRHGVRPPTKAPPMPEGTARDAWPSWPVPPGYLTPNGAAAVRLLGSYDRAQWIAAGVLPQGGCARMRIVADSDQRTIATAQHYLATLSPDCVVPIEHKPQDVPDPLFSPIDEQAVAFDPAAARRAVLAGLGPRGLAAEEARLRPLLTRLDAILCDGAPIGPCGVSREPTGLTPVTPHKRPKLTGALDRASTAAQILLLQYADGKPMAQVGWGRASAADIAALAELHAVEFRILARPRLVAKANLGLIAPLIADAVARPEGDAVTMISGHDTNVASLGGLLGLHWSVPGLSADDPAPGGAIVFERLRDARGRLYVRALYRAQTIDQIRALTPLTGADPYVTVMPIAGCRALGQPGLCTLAQFTAALKR